MTIALSLAFVSGCGASAPTQSVAVATPAKSAVGAPSRDDASVSNVAIADDIRRACGLAESEAFFAYNSARVAAGQEAILKKLAECFSTGPLAGREMRLVGHADPRGEADYNYVLGQSRADNVKSSIVTFGLSPARVSTTSRGELEATGSDESGWSKDRRVDVLLSG